MADTPNCATGLICEDKINAVPVDMHVNKSQRLAYGCRLTKSDGWSEVGRENSLGFFLQYVRVRSGHLIVSARNVAELSKHMISQGRSRTRERGGGWEGLEGRS